MIPRENHRPWLSRSSPAPAKQTALANDQCTADALSRTQKRPSTERTSDRISNSQISFSAGQSLAQRMSGLSSLQDDMGQALATVQSAISGIDCICALIEAAKNAAHTGEKTATAAVLASDAEPCWILLSQIDECAVDSGSPGSNLLLGDDLTLALKGSGTSTLAVPGFTAPLAGLGITAAFNDLDAAIATLKRNSAHLSAKLDGITIRRDFTAQMMKTLTAGSDQLTHADLNEEGANMRRLQTRQMLGMKAARLTVEGRRSILRLF